MDGSVRLVCLALVGSGMILCEPKTGGSPLYCSKSKAASPLSFRSGGVLRTPMRLSQSLSGSTSCRILSITNLLNSSILLYPIHSSFGMPKYTNATLPDGLSLHARKTQRLVIG